MSTELLAPVLKPSQAGPTSVPRTRPPAPSQAPQHGIRALQRSVGNQALQRLLKANLLQAKLTVSQPGDVYEREADQVAETVMRTPQAGADVTGVPQVPAVSSPALGSIPSLPGPGDQSNVLPEHSESAVLAQTSGGQPLTPSDRSFFEPRFNADLGSVRVHTDTHAADSAQAVGARAFTLGNHIVFNHAEYAPESDAGRRLLAHELVHVIQQSGSPQAVQRQPALAEPETAQAPAPAAAPASSTALANAGQTVYTNWFIDFSGVANNGRKKGRGDRDPGDSLILEDFNVGPKDHPRTFPKAGDAQKSGYANLGAYDHPKGPGSAGGTVSYANRRELDVKLSWDGQKKNEKKQAAQTAATQTVEKLIFHQSDVSGDWNEVETQAAAAAAEFLPVGSNPRVEIQWRGNHQEYALKTVDYDVRNPSLCTAEISVPTTSSAVDWTASDSKEHVQHNETHTADQSHVDTDAQTAHAQASGQANSSQNVDKTHEKDTSDEHHLKQTHIHTETEVTREELEQSSKQVYTGMSESLRVSWAKILKKLQLERGDKTVPQEEEEKELSWGDKVKKWFKDRGKDVIDLVKNKLYSKVKGWISGKIKGYIKKLLFVGMEVEAWWFPLVGWGVDWAVGKLGDKIRGKLEVHKGKDERDTPQPPCDPVLHALVMDYSCGSKTPPANSNYTANETTLQQLYDYVSEILTSSNTATETETDIKESFKKVYDDYEASSSNKSQEHSKDTLAAKAHSDASGSADASQNRVRTSADHQGSSDSGEGDLITTTRIYHGTTIKVTAGQPILTIKIQEKP